MCNLSEAIAERSRAEGRAEGREEGIAEERKNSFNRLLQYVSRGLLPAAEVAKDLGMTEEEVRERVGVES